ncbi:DinB family protein [Cellulomonas sp. McL0617]|uniref:DinB family protein n=1 Tax=Cellulomonas sp. McL0617 TaxID=3415675 RepID=UPI003CEA46FE
MPRFTQDDQLQGAEFVGVNLRDARFVESDLSGVVMRGVDAANADIDAPWIADEGSSFWINGVDVAPLVEAELDRRFPGRSQRRAADPDGLRAAWEVLQDAWAATLERVATMPAGTVDVSVGGEWSFAQTLRHLVHATDVWLGKAVLERTEPFHPIGQPDSSARDAVVDRPMPSYDEVLEVRAGRVAMVRDFLATVTPEQLDAERRNPHAPQVTETVRHCLHVILEEEWEHRRFALRDLDLIAATTEHG